MSKFEETLQRLYEQTRRAHYTRKEVEDIFDDLMKSIGPYGEKTSWPKLKELEENEATKNLSKVKEIDALKLSVAKAYGDDKRGIQADLKDGLKDDGYEILVALADELNLWRDDSKVT